MTRIAAGLLPYAVVAGGIEVFLVHPGGPFFAHQDAGIWSIAKGLLEEGEDRRAAARREFTEEVGVVPPEDGYTDLGEVRMASGKIVHVYAFEADRSLGFVASNDFELEWPRHSGTIHRFPEVDRAAWFGIDEARVHLLIGQHPFLDRLVDVCSAAVDRSGHAPREV
jgi:predicted NUDIX family NTP pyrophosphohydrolase